MKKRVFACLLCAALLAGCAAGDTGNRPKASETPAAAVYEGKAAVSGKNEVVYGSLRADGGVDAAYVVNIWNVQKAGSVEEYGEYTTVKNLTDTNGITLSEGKVSVAAAEGRHYYQGELKNASLPWTVGITYTLDGKIVDPDALGGANGAFSMHIATKRNEGADDGYFDNYLLQVSITLDTENCLNIQAPGGTVANAGKNAVLTYTVMPGKEGNIRVSADVADFHMDGVSISAVPLSMLLEDVDTGDMTGEMDELVDAVSEMNDGVKTLHDGTGDMKSGAKKLTNAAGGLEDGALQLTDGSRELMEGLATFHDGMEKFTDGIKEMEDGAKKLYDGGGEFEKGITEYTGGVSKLAESSKGIAGAFEQINTGLSTGGGIGTGLEALNELPGGLRFMADGLEELHSGLKTVYGTLDRVIKGIPETEMDLDQSDYAAIEALPESTKRKLLGYYEAAVIVRNTYNGGVQEAFLSLIGKEGVVGEEGALSVAQNLDITAGRIESALNGTEGSSQDISSILGELQKLAGGYASFHEGLIKLADSGGELRKGAWELTDGIGEFFMGTGELYDGGVELTDGAFDLMDGSAKIYDGIRELYDGVTEYHNGMQTFYNGTKDLDEGVYELLDGTTQLYDGVQEMPDKVQEEIDALMKDYDKSDFVPTSFASKKNGQVAAVQFVLQTAKIAPPAEKTGIVAVEADKNAFERLVDLFG